VKQVEKTPSLQAPVVAGKINEHKQLFPNVFICVFFAFILLATPGCFTTIDEGRDSGFYIRKGRVRDLHVISLYGDKPLRNFVVEFYFCDEPEKNLFLKFDFDMVFERWKNKPYRSLWTNPKENFLPPRVPESDDYWDISSGWVNYTTTLPSGFAVIPCPSAYWSFPWVVSNSEKRRLHYLEGVEWERFGRLCYQIPLDIVTLPIQLPIMVIFTASEEVGRMLSDIPKSPRIEKPETWERADVEKVVGEYRARYEKYNEDIRRWRAKEQKKATHKKNAEQKAEPLRDKADIDFHDCFQ
jgi:hypothetical protein